MKKIFYPSASVLLALMIAILAVTPVSAWDENPNISESCTGATVTLNPSPHYTDHSGPSQERWNPISTQGEGFFPWGPGFSASGQYRVRYQLQRSNNFGNTWTNVSPAQYSYGDGWINWSANAPGNCSVTFCHVDGLGDSPANYQTLTTSVNGLNGHFNNNGTPKAGHEDDSLGACNPPTTCPWSPAIFADNPACIPPVLGCTNPDALNYNPLATQDDGTCIARVPGCTDPTATNYNPAANVNDGSCTYPVPGCTDPTASNYNPLATVDDGSCAFPVPGCTDPTASNYNPLATVDNGSCTYPVPGCTDPTATNYNPVATVNDGSCTYAVPGCTDPTASNYNPLATVDDGSCTYPDPVCDDGQHWNGDQCIVDPLACDPETGQIVSYIGEVRPEGLEDVTHPACNPTPPLVCEEGYYLKDGACVQMGKGCRQYFADHPEAQLHQDDIAYKCMKEGSETGWFELKWKEFTDWLDGLSQ